MRRLASLFRAVWILLAACNAGAADYQSPVVGTRYFFSSTLTGPFEVEVVSVATDRYTARMQSSAGSPSTQEWLYGILPVAKNRRMGVVSGDLRKLAAIFPLEVGNRVDFKTYGRNSPTERSWSRSNTWEVERKYEIEIGAVRQTVFVIRTLSEEHGVYKSHGRCDFAVALAVCIRLEGETFNRGRADPSGTFSNHLTWAVVEGVDLGAPVLPEDPSTRVVADGVDPSPLLQSEGRSAARSPRIGGQIPDSPPQPYDRPRTAEQRLRQARDLLEKS